jgi:hypothetical protein
MATHQLAKGLASLGRHGDSMLMHVNPIEVEGLRALGAATGRKVTTNPHTGLPEAFDFLDFFTSLIPTGVGMLLGGPAGGAIGSSLGTTAAAAAPVVGGMAAGALVAGAKGEDPLMGGLMGGLGGYGGGNLAKTFGTMGANAANAANVANTATTAGGYSTPAMEEALKQGVAGPILPNAQAANTALLQPGTFNPALSQAIPGATVATMPTAGENMLAGIKELASDPFGKGFESFKQAGGSAFDLAAPIGMAGLAGAQEDLYPEGDNSVEEKRKAEENKYRDPKTGLLNLAQASPGLKLMATGGSVNTNTSTIAKGGIQDLYGANDSTSGTTALSRDGYGIGRLDTLASEGSRAKAADTFYAMGGPIAFAKGGHQGYLDGDGDGMSDSIPATIEGKQPARLADGEFVIPADVVSHIGNGSSKAGSKQLYAMLDRIRKARTGHTKQGKQIKPQKYMPA